MRLAQEPLTNEQGSGGSRSFAKQTRTLKLEDEKCSGRPLEVVNDQLRAIIEADPLTQEVAKKFNVNHSMVVLQIRKVRKFDKWVSHELNASTKLSF